MVRAPYPARIMAGLVVTAIEETKKLPALVITLPMTAVSQTLQAGMRMQQNIAELAIKGDLALEMLFDKPVEQPEWARFDDDDAAIDAEADRTPIESRGETTTAPPPSTAPTVKAPATPKKTAKKAAPATKPPAKPTPPAEQPSDEAPLPTPDTSTGRFALYSSPPEDMINRDGSAESESERGPSASSNHDGPVPEIVEYIEYDNLTLAQLRAKLRGVGLAELEELASYERATKSRAPFVTMIDNRIASQNSKRQQPT